MITAQEQPSRDRLIDAVDETGSSFADKDRDKNKLI